VKESAVEAELVRRVEALGGVCIKIQAIGVRGFFDRIVVLPGGRVIFAEVKKPKGGRLSAHQIRYADLFTALGVRVACVRDSADITRLLNE
jgi:hypothetical protein